MTEEGAPIWVQEVRREGVFSYDTKKYPFAVAMSELLELETGEVLSNIHGRQLSRQVPLCPRLIHSYRFNGKKLPTSWKKAQQNEKRFIKQMVKSDPYVKFMKIYRSFIQEVIAPMIGKSIRCQIPPTMRICMPSRSASIHPHVDADFERHQSSEINFWVPITRVWGNNTLFVESSPGKQDFHPIEIDYGQFLRFNGNECTHFTKANDTDSTRVSFDFRCIPLSEYSFRYDGKIGDYCSEEFEPNG